MRACASTWLPLVLSLSCLLALTEAAPGPAMAPTPGEGRPSAEDFLQTQCHAQAAAHTALITQIFLPWQDGLPLETLFDLRGPFKPILYLQDGHLSWHTSLNAEHNVSDVQPAYALWSSTAQEIAKMVRLPDAALLINPLDGPVADSSLPWIGYCYVRANGISVPWPITLLDATFNNRSSPSRAGPGDPRQAKAVFRGSPTGWARGRRRALMIAGMRHPDLVDAGLASLGGGCGQCHEVEAAELQMWLKPQMSLQDQVDGYRYIVHADGNCAANRMKDLLSGDSALLMVQSPQEEWFYPLLMPYTHFIPVQYEPTAFPAEAGLDIAGQVQWAQDHPEEVAKIVQHANDFAKLHLSRTGQICFVVRMLGMYHDLLQGTDKLRSLTERETNEGQLRGKKMIHRARAHMGQWLNG